MRKVVCALVLLLGACASAGQTGQSPRPRSNPDLITAEQIAAAHVSDAYQAVEQLRPRFLVTQGGTTRSHAVQVIVDQVPQPGGVGLLRNINAGDVLEIRYLSASEATMRFGTGYSGGAILVRTRAGGRS